MEHKETILEALEFERDHWQTRHDRRLPRRDSKIKVWMRERIAHLDEVIKQVTAGGIAQ
jgi:hypothetical protein